MHRTLMSEYDNNDNDSDDGEGDDDGDDGDSDGGDNAVTQGPQVVGISEQPVSGFQFSVFRFSGGNQ